MKILASDFDFTLFVDDKEVLTKNIEAIFDFIKQGNLFVIVTGRNYTNIKPLLNEYNIPYHYLICQDGAKIFDYNDYCFFTSYLSKIKIEKIIEILKKYNFSHYLDDGYNITTNFNDCVKVVGIIDNNYSTAKVVVNELLETKMVYAYLSKEHINIIDNSINKRVALNEILKHAGKLPSDLKVIGDNINDYEMLSSFSGAVMKNHSLFLDKLNCKNYEHLYDYIRELEKN